MRFFEPQMFWLLIPWAIIPLIWVLLEKRATKQLARFVSKDLFRSVVQGHSKRRKVTKFVLGYIAILLGIVALARPQLGAREEVIPSVGLDLVFLLDVSNSMLTEDIVPSRLKKSKHVIKNFLDRLSGDRVGVVSFAGSAYVAAPLTTDYEFIKQVLGVLDQSSVQNQGTNIKSAVDVAIKLLKQGGLNEGGQDSSSGEVSQVVVVLSDGEAHTGGIKEIAKKLKAVGAKVYSIGVGSFKGGPIPLRDASGYLRGYKKDKSGTLVHTKLEETSLKKLASETGGKYYIASSNEGEVEEIIGMTSGLDRVEGGGRRVIVYEEIFQIPLGIATMLLLFMIAIRDASWRRLAVILLFVSTSAHAATVKEYQSTKEGMKAYEAEEYSEAIEHFENAQALNPNEKKHHLNLGDALLKGGSPEGAAKEFNEYMNSQKGNEAAKGAFNLGKAFEAAEQHELALQAYQKGLEKVGEAEKPDPEVLLRLKRALEVAEQKKKQNKKKKDKQDSDKGDKDKKKDPQRVSNPKPKFKGKKLTERDAKRILKQLLEKEKQVQKRMMQEKGDKKAKKTQPDKAGKDW